jgi:hypothetical protein
MNDEHETETAGFSNWAPVIGRWELSEESAIFNGPRIRPDSGPGFGMLLSPWAMRDGSASVTVAIESTTLRTAIPDDFADKGPDPTLPQARMHSAFSPERLRCVIRADDLSRPGRIVDVGTGGPNVEKLAYSGRSRQRCTASQFALR